MKTHIRFTDFPPHSHDYVEIMYVCRGKLTTVIANEEIELTAGDIIILGKDAIHSTKKTVAEDICTVFLVSPDFFLSVCNKLRSKLLISDKFFSKLTATDTSTYCLFHTYGISEIENLMENIISSFIYDRNENSNIGQLEFQLMMSYLVGISEVRSEICESNSKVDILLRDFNNYIETGYTTANLSDLSEMLGFTPAYTCRWINKHYGTSFIDILRDKRLSVALELLTTSSLSINEIIRAVGYENTSYFYKEFNKHFGATPKEIRDNVKK